MSDTGSYFDLYPYSAYAAHYVYFYFEFYLSDLFNDQHKVVAAFFSLSSVAQKLETRWWDLLLVAVSSCRNISVKVPPNLDIFYCLIWKNV